MEANPQYGRDLAIHRSEAQLNSGTLQTRRATFPFFLYQQQKGYRLSDNHFSSLLSKVKIGWINSLLLNSNFFFRLSQFLTNNDILLPYAAAAALLLCRGDVIFGTELGLKPFLSLLLLVSWIASYLCSASSSFKFITFKPSLIKNSSILSSKVPA